LTLERREGAHHGNRSDVTEIYDHDTISMLYIGHEVVLREVNWWRFVTLFK